MCGTRIYSIIWIEYIQPPLLGGNAGIAGALFLAAQEAASAEFDDILKRHHKGERG